MDVIPEFSLSTKLVIPPASANILIVDDEPLIRAAYRHLLADTNRHIEECGTGREAIARLEHQDIDVIVLDLGLPDINGRDVMEWISNRRLNTSIIVFSAEDTIDAAIFALRRGACEFIRKNSDPDELVRTVQMALRRRHLERDHALMTAQLEQSERLHRFLVEQSPDIIYTLDPHGHFVFINSRIEALLGYRHAELVGKHYSVIVDEDDLENARYAFAERRVGDRATSNHEVRLRCKDAQVRFFENRSIVAILSSQGIYGPGQDASTQKFMGTSGVLRDITERKRAEETITFQAFHDLLTGLPNRVLFRDRLALAISQAKRRNQRIGVMYMDIDRFKLINDTFGHTEGDQLLKHFSQRIRDCLRVGDTLSRQGGDEFTVLLPDIPDVGAIETIAEKMLCELRTPFAVGGKEVRATASIGIAVFPDDGIAPEVLLRNADLAMYQIKSRGKNGFLRYVPDMSRNHAGRIDLENEMRTAIEQGQFELHYQPQINVPRNRLIGLEGLIRWQHPVRGLIVPNDFITIAEETGLIFALSDWVLDEGCRQMAAWQHQGLTGFKLALNISPLEFNRADFVQRMVAPLARHALHPGLIEIEITENLLMDDAESIIDKVRLLREHGLRISIDDFGTRYSSLNYLRRFAVNTVKIDQSFIRDIKQADDPSPVISAIVGIARGFDLNVLAEGVESETQMQALIDLGCDDMQGFLFCPPCRQADLLAYLGRSCVAAREPIR